MEHPGGGALLSRTCWFRCAAACAARRCGKLSVLQLMSTLIPKAKQHVFRVQRGECRRGVMKRGEANLHALRQALREVGALQLMSKDLSRPKLPRPCTPLHLKTIS